jgi:hypothetical protein
VLELVDQKRRGEKTELSESLSVKWAARLDAMFAGLLAAEANSVLPREPQNAAVLEEALISLRASA